MTRGRSEAVDSLGLSAMLDLDQASQMMLLKSLGMEMKRVLKRKAFV